MTSGTREKSEYEYMASQLLSNGVKSLICGTDRELAMEAAFEEEFPINNET